MVRRDRSYSPDSSNKRVRDTLIVHLGHRRRLGAIAKGGSNRSRYDDDRDRDRDGEWDVRDRDRARERERERPS